MSRRTALLAGVLLLTVLWSGRWDDSLPGAFTAHMIVHMGVVALAAPLLAWGLAGSRVDPFRHTTGGAVPVLAAVVEFGVVWGWHAPALHDAARLSAAVYVLEQLSFLLAGLLVWLAAWGVAGAASRARRAAGVIGLLLTSMHMSLLGALLALAPRPLYLCAALCGSPTRLDALDDQALGGTVMLILGGSAYLVGGLVLMAGLLAAPAGALPGAARHRRMPLR